jgi:actin-related protein 5
MSELLFECYHVPSVAYGVDALFSLYNNQKITGITAHVLECTTVMLWLYYSHTTVIVLTLV